MNGNDPETRSLDLAAAEVRAEQADGGRPVIRGVALRYGSLSRTLKDAKGRPFREQFTPGAFSRALATGADVRFLVNHNRDLILGRNTSGTLRLFDEPDALRFELDPPDTEIARHYLTLLRRGDISGVSFRFYKIADAWAGTGEATVRTVSEADIDDVSIVTNPAYGDTVAEAATRSLDEHYRDQAHGRSQPRHDPRRALAGMRLRLAEADL